MSTVSDDEIERLASRMAMLVSGDGEADNAGRAVGAMARRIGLSGGQLKAIFVAGIKSAAGSARLAEQAARMSQMETEIDRLRETLRKTEGAMRSLQRERDVLRGETERLGSALDERRSGRQVKWAVGLVSVLAIVGAVYLARFGPRLRLFGDMPDKQVGTPFYHSAVVRDRPLPMHASPDETTPVTDTFAVGTHLTVKRVLWHNLQQWVEIEVGSETGYVLSTDVDLS